ncbi:glycosyltransferase [Companilactobacillus allii]|uniref:Glycosyltransferase 2-like domain-containing protein n=1 Tax=Companilactobacillus allii TaxID=1847728 RepID=A0A1P8Q292_9LACO|nr:glycosyltransferase [Companilactobacillus allii]APX71955.1 hypothetical protein BTM29_05015 [Companilactobacillus allii]USQ69050.1 glycosyltransferase [Companilactobacillus allii]
MSVSILLATFNGDKYLRKQIDSIIGQTYSDWKLYIRDDSSTDKTQLIIDDYVAIIRLLMSSRNFINNIIIR